MKNKIKALIGEYLIMFQYIKRPVYLLSIAIVIFVTGITFVFSNLQKLDKEQSPFANTEQPIVHFSKYNALKNNFAEVKAGLDDALKNNQNVTLVFIQEGCNDCEKIEGELTYYYYYYSHLKNNKTRYLMLDMQDVSDQQLQWLVKNIPSKVIYPVLKTPTVVNLIPKTKKWFYGDAFIEKGSTKKLKGVFKDSISI